MGDLQQRRAEEKEQRREAIVDAAERVFGSRGFEHATMEDVARAARVSRALLYLYFRNKADLQLALCLRALDMLRERFVAAAAQHPRGVDKIAAIGRAYFTFADDRPCYFEALSRFEAHRITANPEDAMERAVFEAGMSVHAVTIAALQHGIRDGSVRPDVDPLLTSISLWAFTHGMIQLAQTKCPFFEEVGISIDRFIDYSFGLGQAAVRNTSPDAEQKAP